MFKINDNYLKLPGSYLFSTIAKKVNAYSQANPEKSCTRPRTAGKSLPGPSFPDTHLNRVPVYYFHKFRISPFRKTHMVFKIKEGKVANVRVNMGAPILAAEDIPVISGQKEAIAERIEVEGKDYLPHSENG